MSAENIEKKPPRGQMLAARFTDEEAQAIRAMADRAGTTVASLIRSSMLGLPAFRATRRPTVNHEAAGRLLSELGSVAESFRQATDAAPDQAECHALLDAAARDLAEMRLVLFQAMGREP